MQTHEWILTYLKFIMSSIYKFVLMFPWNWYFCFCRELFNNFCGLVTFVQATIICCYKIYDSTLKTSRSPNSRRVLRSETFELQTPMWLMEEICSLLGGVQYLQVFLTRTNILGTEWFIRYLLDVHYSEVLMYSSLNLLHIYY